MSWRWVYLDADSAVVPSKEEEAESFSSQSDAETWLGENWRELAADEVAAVRLVTETEADAAKTVYTMPLTE